jgi:valyl-tRNA synthetase
MSKSKGNVMDPLELVDAYGADALRFTLTAMSGQARDIRLSVQRIEGYRNFATKLWNAARFCEMNHCAAPADFDPGAAKASVNRWILGETVKTTAAVTAALDACAFDDAANALYRFVWNTYCDWYLELIKPVLQGADEAAEAETRAMAAWVLATALELLHPVMPFVTEELWAKTGERDQMLIVTPWPRLPEAWIDPAAEAEISLVVGAIGVGRALRSELNVPPAARPPLLVVEADAAQRAVLEANQAVIGQMLRVSGLKFDAVAAGAVPYLADGAAFALPVAEFIDLAAERARLAKEVAARDSEIERARRKLANADFLSRAPSEVVEENRERLAESEAGRARLEAALTRLEALG